MALAVYYFQYKKETSSLLQGVFLTITTLPLPSIPINSYRYIPYDGVHSINSSEYHSRSYGSALSTNQLRLHRHAVSLGRHRAAIQLFHWTLNLLL